MLYSSISVQRQIHGKLLWQKQPRKIIFVGFGQKILLFEE